MSYSHDWNEPSRPPWWGPRSTGHAPYTPPGQMRVSDLERQEITDALCRHYADGRLDEAEFNARMEKATAAKTRDDLAPLLIDLPPLGGPVATGPHPPAPRRGIPVVLLVVVAALIAATALPFTFAAWNARWLLVVAVVAFFALRSRRRRGHCFHA